MCLNSKIYGDYVDSALLKLIEDYKYIPYRLNKTSKHRVGKIYWNGYWHQSYTVLNKKENGYIEVLWDDGKTTEHCTPLDSKRDFELREFSKVPVDYYDIVGNNCNSYTAGEIRAFIYLGFINNYSGLTVDKLISDYFKTSNNRCIQNDYAYYFVRINTNKVGESYYKLERDLSKSPHNFGNIKTYADLCKDIRIKDFLLYDKNGDYIFKSLAIPLFTPVNEISYIPDTYKQYIINLDAIVHNETVYGLSNSGDGNRKLYSSIDNKDIYVLKDISGKEILLK